MAFKASSKCLYGRSTYRGTEPFLRLDVNRVQAKLVFFDNAVDSLITGDPYVLRDIAITLLDCGLRPDECFRLSSGKRARRSCRSSVRQDFECPASGSNVRPGQRTDRGEAESKRYRPGFPAPTKSGHAEPSTIKDHHAKAIELSEVEPFVLYPLRHTCLTRWASHRAATPSVQRKAVKRC